MRDVGIRKLEEDSEDVQRSVLGGVLKYAISGEARTLSRTTRDWLPAGPRYSGTCLKRHFWNLREETLILFYKQRARAERTTTRWSLPDDGRWSLIKETMFLCCVYAFASFPSGYEPRYAMLCKTALKYLGLSEMAQWCCSKFQRSSLQKFLLQGRSGYGLPIRLSKDWMCSSGKCWSNTGVDGLMKLNALSRLSLRCFGF